MDEFEEALENPALDAEQADEELAAAGASLLQAVVRGRNERKEFLATKIQAQIRGQQSRKKAKKQKESATKIQAQVRGRRTRKKVLETGGGKEDGNRGGSPVT